MEMSYYQTRFNFITKFEFCVFTMMNVNPVGIEMTQLGKIIEHYFEFSHESKIKHVH